MEMQGYDHDRAEQKTEPHGAIIEIVGRLEKVADILTHQAHELADRIAPVLREFEDVPARHESPPAIGPAPSSTLAGRLEGIAESVQRAQRYLYDLGARVDL